MPFLFGQVTSEWRDQFKKQKKSIMLKIFFAESEYASVLFSLKFLIILYPNSASFWYIIDSRVSVIQWLFCYILKTFINKRNYTLNTVAFGTQTLSYSSFDPQGLTHIKHSINTY